MSKRKSCASCGQRRLLKKFGACHKSRDGLQAWCRSCRANYEAHKYRTNPLYREKRRRERLSYISRHRWRVAAQQMVLAARKRAEKRNIAFSITVDFIKDKLERKMCEATGLPLAINVNSGPGFFSPTLDRISPRLGYTRSNTRIVCFAFNAAKGSGTDADVLKMARALLAQERKRAA